MNCNQRVWMKHLHLCDNHPSCCAQQCHVQAQNHHQHVSSLYQVLRPPKRTGSPPHQLASTCAVTSTPRGAHRAATSNPLRQKPATRCTTAPCGDAVTSQHMGNPRTVGFSVSTTVCDTHHTTPLPGLHTSRRRVGVATQARSSGAKPCTADKAYQLPSQGIWSTVLTDLHIAR